MDVRLIPAKLKGSVSAMPSKSYGHRILLAKKLAEIQGGKQNGNGFCETFSGDIRTTKACLAQLEAKSPVLDCGESGTTFRFLLPVTMALREKAVFLGAETLARRPIAPLRQEMEAHGCRFEVAPVQGKRPGQSVEAKKQNVARGAERNTEEDSRKLFCVTGRLQAGTYRLSGNLSSQMISGLLFALPLLWGDSCLQVSPPLESAGYVEMTLEILKKFGIVIQQARENKTLLYHIAGRQRYRTPDLLNIEGDWSNGAVWLACGALGGNVTCRGLNPFSSQRDREIIGCLQQMGAKIDREDMNVTCRGNQLQAIWVDVCQTPDLAPVLAVLLAASHGVAQITGGKRLGFKESDRLQTIYEMLAGLGATIKRQADGFQITGQPRLRGGRIDGKKDHRIVMAAAVASCICEEPVIIQGAQAVCKSYPGFFEKFQSLGGKVELIADLRNRGE